MRSWLSVHDMGLCSRGRLKKMRREYDFSKVEQGRFYRKGAVIQLPIYLDSKVQAQVERVARKNGKDVSELVNHVVQKEMELIEKLTQ